MKINQMEKYIKQLIEDIDEAINNPPTPDYYEVPPSLEKQPEIAELAITPYKRLSELSGILVEAFPPSVDYPHMDLMRIVLEKIFKLFEAYHIDLIDIPEDIPDEMLYDAIALNWDIYIQYLPSSGFDLQLCTGDPQTCLYGEYCDCCEEEEDVDGYNY